MLLKKGVGTWGTWDCNGYMGQASLREGLVVLGGKINLVVVEIQSDLVFVLEKAEPWRNGAAFGPLCPDKDMPGCLLPLGGAHPVSLISVFLESIT